MKNSLTILLICLFAANSFAQNEAANWYFGSHAGLRFNLDGSTTTLTDGKLNTFEGCTTISDSNGKLLFYTDGITVWDKTHQPMPNANNAIGNGLFGDPSSSQSAIVVPKPNDPNIFYIFTVDTSTNNNEPDRGFNYSTVDLTLNGGLGDVVASSKNVNLLQDSSEKITAVSKDCVSKSIWVITFAPNGGRPGFVFDTFYAYEVSTAGINTTPVASHFNISIQDGRGYLKLSPDGTKLACANSTSGLNLYDFDATTGIVSNQIPININFSPLGKPQSPYGVEFSQSNKLLYVSAYYNPTRNESNIPSSHYGALLQYNLTAANINSSETVIDDRQMYRGALQLGANGKIYRAMSITYDMGSPYLSTINSPNEIGLACNYVHNAINLSPFNSTQGLPPFITSFFSEKIDIIGNRSTSTNLALCIDETFTLKAPEIIGANYTWTHDGMPLSNNTFDLEVSQVGFYKVVIDQNNGDCGLLEGEAFVTYNQPPTGHNAILVQCDEDGISGGSTRFNLHEADQDLTGGVSGLSTKFYLDISRSLEIDASNFSYDSSNPNPIYVKIIDDATNCFDTSVLTLQVNTVPRDRFIVMPVCDELNSQDGIHTFDLDDIALQIQTNKNIGFPISFYDTLENALLEKNALGTSFTNTEPYSQIIFARFENQNACQGITEVLFTINKLPIVEPDETVFYCTNKFPETISINAGNLNLGNTTDDNDEYSYLWDTGEETYQINVNDIKDYTVLITNKTTNCSKERTIHVQASSIARNPSFKVTDATQNNTITILVSGDGIYEYAIDNFSSAFYIPFQQSNVFENVPPGVYKVLINDVKNDCGTLPIDVPVIGFPKFFTPNNDGINDTWQVLGISEFFNPNSKIIIYNRYGTLIKEIDPLGKGWDGSFNGDILPADDYWFSVILENGKIFKNHFTLKR